jgi:FkbM family methyltransferase
MTAIRKTIRSFGRRLGADVRPIRNSDGRVVGIEARRPNTNHSRATVIRAAFEGSPVFFYVDDDDDVIQREHVKGQFYEAEELALIRKHFKGGTFVDIGANVGNHSIFAGKFMGADRVLAFEPNPAAYIPLKCNIGLNALERVVQHFPLGLSDNPGRASFSTPNGNLGGTRLSDSADGEFEIARGDDVIEGPVGFIKLDAEGMELAVLSGLSKTIEKNRPSMFVEVESKSIPGFVDFVRAASYDFAEDYSRYAGVTNFLITPKAAK